MYPYVPMFPNDVPYTNFHALNQDWIVRTVKELELSFPHVTDDLNKKLNKPVFNPDGTLNDVLISNGDGSTAWKSLDDTILPGIARAVDEWLDEHPEATTTVVDGSITRPKLNNSVVNDIRSLNFSYNPTLSAEVVVWKDTPSGYAFPQGFAVVGDDIYLGYSSPDNAANGMIQRNRFGVYTNLAGDFYHMNSMCSDGDLLYSLDCLVGNNPATPVFTVSIIDLNLFAFANRLTLNYTGTGSLSGLMYHNGLFVMDSEGKIFQVDSQGDLTLYTTLDMLTGTTQQTCMDNDFIYVSSTYPNAIFIYTHEGHLWNVIPIGNRLPNICPVTELEAIFIDGQYIYIRYANTTNEDVIVRCNMFQTIKSSTTMFDGNFVQELYVDGNENSDERIRQHKFCTIQNAINYASGFTNGKFVIKPSVNSDEHLEMNFKECSIRIDGNNTITFSGDITMRAGELTMQNMIFDVSDTNEFCYITNATNCDCYLNLKGTVTGSASTYFLNTFGRCYIYLELTGESNNLVQLGAYAHLVNRCNMNIVAAQKSSIQGSGIFNNITGYLSSGVCVAKPVDITLGISDTEITQSGINAEQNTWIELRTENGCKASYFLSTANQEIHPFYVTDGTNFDIYYIRVRRDSSNKLYAMVINPPADTTIKLNLIVFH